jgi:hypothetical protein
MGVWRSFISVSSAVGMQEPRAVRLAVQLRSDEAFGVGAPEYLRIVEAAIPPSLTAHSTSASSSAGVIRRITSSETMTPRLALPPSVRLLNKLYTPGNAQELMFDVCLGEHTGGAKAWVPRGGTDSMGALKPMP